MQLRELSCSMFSLSLGVHAAAAHSDPVMQTHARRVFAAAAESPMFGKADSPTLQCIDRVTLGWCGQLGTRTVWCFLCCLAFHPE